MIGLRKFRLWRIHNGWYNDIRVKHGLQFWIQDINTEICLFHEECLEWGKTWENEESCWNIFIFNMTGVVQSNHLTQLSDQHYFYQLVCWWYHQVDTNCRQPLLISLPKAQCLEGSPGLDQPVEMTHTQAVLCQVILTDGYKLVSGQHD